MNWVFRAKVNHVENSATVDMALDLGFNIKKREVFHLNGYAVPEYLEKNAKSCLILLVGGRRLLAQTEKSQVGETSVWTAHLYTYEAFNQDGVSEVVVDRRLPCVNKIMRRLEREDFDPEWLKTRITISAGDE